MTLKLEVGKTYRNRVGDRVSIHARSNNSPYLYVCSEGMTFTESGRYLDDVTDSPFDLVKEVEQKVLTPVGEAPKPFTELLDAYLDARDEVKKLREEYNQSTGYGFGQTFGDRYYREIYRESDARKALDEAFAKLSGETK